LISLDHESLKKEVAKRQINGTDDFGPLRGEFISRPGGGNQATS
jgi:hypothetical protein